MTDNVLINPGTGEPIAADEITDGGVADGVKVQRFKPGFGPDGEYRDVTAEAGLPVSPAYKQFTASTNLPEAELFSADVSAYRWVTLTVTGLPTTDPIAWVSVEVSANGSDWWPLDQLYDFSEQRLETELQTDTVAAGPVFAPYMRAVLHTNDNEPAASLVDVTAMFSAAPSQIVGLGADLRWQGAPVDSYHSLPVALAADTSYAGLNADGEYLMSTNAGRFRQALYQVGGPFTGSIAFEVSVLGSGYTALPVTPAGDPGAPQMAVTEPGLYVLQTEGADFIRAVMTGYVDGTAAIYGQFTALPGTAGGGGGGGDLSYDGTAVTAADGLPTTPASRVATYPGTVHGSELFTEDVTGCRGISITSSAWVDDGWSAVVEVSNDGGTWTALSLWSPYLQQFAAEVSPSQSYEAPLNYRYARATLWSVSEADLSAPASVTVQFSAAAPATPYTVAQMATADGTLVGPDDPLPVAISGGSINAELYVGGAPVDSGHRVPVDVMSLPTGAAIPVGGTDGTGILTLKTSAAGNLIVQVTGVPAVDTELPPAAALNDTTNAPIVPTIGAHNLVYGPSSTWHRMRTAAVAEGGAGTGLLGAGVLGLADDGGYYGIKVDTSGVLQVAPDNAGGLPVQGTVGISGTVPVSGTVGVSGTVPVTGTVGISGTVPISAASALSTTGGYIELTGSASASNADLIASTDVRGYRWFTLQMWGTYNASITASCSNDGVTWSTIPLTIVTGSSAIAAMPSTSAQNNTAAIFAGAIYGRYFRVRTSTYVSGTVNVTVELCAQPTLPPGLAVSASASSSNPLYVTGNASAAADAASTNNMGLGFSVLGALGSVYNGTSWDRARSATSATGTTGTGLPGNGVLGWDGTNYRRLLADTTGILQVNESQAGTAALTNVASSASTGSIVAARTLRKGLVIYNDSTAVLYLAYASTASLTAFSYKIAAGVTFEMPQPVYNGAVSGIWDAANGNARVTELY